MRQWRLVPKSLSTAMAYCTTAQYLTEFGLQEATQALQDEARDLTEAALNEAVRGLPPTGTALEQAAASSALARLQSMIDEAALMMDSYIGAATALPLTAPQIASNPLKTCNLELTRCQLMDDADNGTVEQGSRCDKWRAWLKDLAKKLIAILPAGSATPPVAPPALGAARLVLCGQGSSRFDWGAHARNTGQGGF